MDIERRKPVWAALSETGSGVARQS
jgi:hypothetical protein